MWPSQATGGQCSRPKVSTWMRAGGPSTKRGPCCWGGARYSRGLLPECSSGSGAHLDDPDVSAFPSGALAPCLHWGPSEQGQSGHPGWRRRWEVTVWLDGPGSRRGLCRPVFCPILSPPSSLLGLPAQRGDSGDEAQAWTDPTVQEVPEVRWASRGGAGSPKTPGILCMVTQGVWGVGFDPDSRSGARKPWVR